MNPKTLKIIFFGTPEFAVGSLKKLIENKYNVVAVVTAPDKPAGRGLKIRQSDVMKFAEASGIKTLQPTNLKEEKFISEIKDFNADLFIVVAFRMLPEIIWKMPTIGTFNLHASLLPNYRGAAPINWAIINGESKTGVTTFFINEAIDTGTILLQKEVSINKDDTASSLYDKLNKTGSELVIETVDLIASGNYTLIDQSSLFSESTELKKAPKIFSQHKRIDWIESGENIYNKIRGLSAYPCANFNLKINTKVKTVKVFSAIFEPEKNATIGEIKSDNKSYFKIGCQDGYISLKSLQQEGKKRMNIDEYLRGFNKNQAIEIAI